MDLVKKDSNYTATKVIPSEADVVSSQYEVYTTLFHEWGKQIVAKARATRTTTRTYEVTYNAIKLLSHGVYKIKWEYTVSGTVYTEYTTFKVYTPYSNADDFFVKYPYVQNSGNTELFDAMEQKVRNIIHAFCGQTFDYYNGLYVNSDGNDGRNLSMPVKINSITEVIATISDSLGTTSSDETESIEKAPDSEWFIRWKGNKGTFKSYASYKVTGDWGWFYVPDNVTQASELLIAEQFNDDNAYRNHGVTDLYMDTHRMRIDEKISFNSTGIIDADVLLMDYVKYDISWV